MSEEQKQQQFDAWKQTAEYKAIEKFKDKRSKTSMLVMSTSDITGNYQTFLDELYLFLQEIKYY